MAMKWVGTSSLKKRYSIEFQFIEKNLRNWIKLNQIEFKINLQSRYYQNSENPVNQWNILFGKRHWCVKIERWQFNNRPFNGSYIIINWSHSLAFAKRINVFELIVDLMLWSSMLLRAIAFWLINFMQIKQWIANYMLKLFPKAIFWCDLAALEYELISMKGST